MADKTTTQKLGRYSVYGTIAKGTFSRVRYSVAADTGESFALRIIDRTKIEEEGLLENLKNEITIMKMLDHRCVVNVKDMLASNNRIFLVLDLMMGGNLRMKILREGYLNETESRFYFQQLFCGVEYLHNNGIIHNNLRCENLLLHPDGTLKITDFSMSLILESDMTLGLGGGIGGVSSIVEKVNESGVDEREGVRFHTLHERLLALKGSPLYLAPEVSLSILTWF